MSGIVTVEQCGQQLQQAEFVTRDVAAENELVEGEANEDVEHVTDDVVERTVTEVVVIEPDMEVVVVEEVRYKVQLESRKSKEKCSKKKKKGIQKREAFLKCPWTKNHANKTSLSSRKTIQNLTVTDKFGVPAAGLQVITRRSNRDMLINSKENVEDVTNKKLIELTKDISKRLNEDVFNEEGEEIIGYTRTVLDLPALAIKMRKEQSSLKVALTEFPTWLASVRNIPVDDLNDISEDELKGQFKLFMKRLEVLSNKYSLTELQILDTKILIKKFFDPEGSLYVDIEMVLQAMAIASVKHSCESILESFVSEYENHFDERRNVDENTANEEFEIAVNGPNLAHADAVILEAMSLYWKGKPWHFYRTSPLEKLVNPSGTSKTLKRLDSVKNSLPIMD